MRKKENRLRKRDRETEREREGWGDMEREIYKCICMCTYLCDLILLCTCNACNHVCAPACAQIYLCAFLLTRNMYLCACICACAYVNPRPCIRVRICLSVCMCACPSSFKRNIYQTPFSVLQMNKWQDRSGTHPSPAFTKTFIILDQNWITMNNKLIRIWRTSLPVLDLFIVTVY